MILILTVVLIVGAALFAVLSVGIIAQSPALPVPAVAPYAIYHPLLAWICVAILCYFVIGEGGHIVVGR